MNTAAILAPVLGFGLTLGLIRLLLPRAERWGLIDHPGAGRKDHGGATPTVGGLAVAAGLALAALLGQFAAEMHPAFWAGLLLLALTGTADDILELQPAIKFAAQIAAALLMVYWGGRMLHSLGNLVSTEPLTLGRLAVPLTVFAVIGVVNAVNFCDGADGLAGGLVFIAVFWIAVMSAATAQAGPVTLPLGLLGCTAAFLAFNLRSPWRSRATIFLGDAGSLSLGFVVAWLTVDAAQPRAQLFAPVTAIWLVAIPISDTIVCMSRRLLRGQSPFRADRTHLHHILIDLGMPAGSAVALILAIAFVLAAAGVAGWALGIREHVMFYSAMAVFALYILLVQLGLWRLAVGRSAAAVEHKI
ncbi:MAG: undecaprenyl/decaprenyl-phosphate alpha-N-acetylglucosaminyl 1-phosphate transferase [Burkholderiales bacterium]|nr:undecaprenyl/decaprenyl-phosphate alpha-N-acetylglucosaminyl 1-phosphate transferase [Burkholderiales bacterium]